ncbi:hypothetical protein [Xanthomonas albilineans]|uniref:hypothetical protein n=1 Tax=Xanthomonas albilineans TaxID=29447 RepID=UPI000AAB74A1|nr:hypothetical protein [Xanthomonas albilineans]
MAIKPFLFRYAFRITRILIEGHSSPESGKSPETDASATMIEIDLILSLATGP